MGRTSGNRCTEEACDFTLCKECSECTYGHLLSVGSGKPAKYSAEMQVVCNRCGKKGLHEDQYFSYCDPCDFALCEKCVHIDT